MKQFNYIKARSIDEALTLLAKERNSAKLVAGGMDLLSLIKDNIATPEILIDITDTKLDYIYEDADNLHVGGTVTLSELLKNDIVKKKYMLLTNTLSQIANVQVRNRASIAGNVLQRPRCHYFRGPFKCLRKSGTKCYALTGNNKYHCIIGGGPCFIVHPSDLATALLALEAKLLIKSPKKEKTISMNEFFVLPKINSFAENILSNDEIITEIKIPTFNALGKGIFLKVRERKTGDYGLMSVAMLETGETGKRRNLKVVIGQIAPMPYRAISAEEILQRGLTSKDILAAASKILQEAEPLSDNSFKSQMLKGILADAVDLLNEMK